MGDKKEPVITMRTIGGIIDLHLFLGPTPEEINSQYTRVSIQIVFLIPTTSKFMITSGMKNISYIEYSFII